MVKLRFFTNGHDPRHEDWEEYQIHDLHTMMNGPKAIAEANNRRLDNIRSRLIGRPQASDTLAIDALEDMNMVGEYSFEIDDYARKNPEDCTVDYNGPLYRWNPSIMTWQCISVPSVGDDDLIIWIHDTNFMK